MTTEAPPTLAWIVNVQANNCDETYYYPDEKTAWRAAAAFVLQNLEKVGCIETEADIHRLAIQGDFMDVVTDFNEFVNQDEFQMEVLIWQVINFDTPPDFDAALEIAGNDLQNRIDTETQRLAELETKVAAAQPKVWIFTNVHHGFLGCVHACTTEAMAQRIAVEHFIRDEDEGDLICVGDLTSRPCGDWAIDWAWIQDALKQQDIQDEQAVILEMELNT
jgi:hypothetical protein